MSDPNYLREFKEEKTSQIYDVVFPNDLDAEVYHRFDIQLQNISRYAGPGNNNRFKIRIEPKLTSVEWADDGSGPLNGIVGEINDWFPFFFIGRGGALPYSSFGQWVGTPYTSKITIEPSTDLIAGATCTFHRGKLSDSSVCFGVDASVGNLVSAGGSISWSTSLDRNRSVQVVCVGNNCHIAHLPMWDWGEFFGFYWLESGFFELELEISENRSSSRESGKIILDLPFMYGWNHQALFCPTYHIFEWNSLANIPAGNEGIFKYFRRSGLKPLVPVDNPEPFSMNENSDGVIRLNLKNTSEELEMQNVELLLDTSSLDWIELLSPRLIEFNAIAAGEIKGIEFRLRAGPMEGKDPLMYPVLTIKNKYGAPVPVDVEVSDEFNMPSITVIPESGSYFRGVVHDSSTGLPLVNSLISIYSNPIETEETRKSESSNPVKAYNTKVDGQYMIVLDPGSYTALVSREGYKDAEVKIIVDRGKPDIKTVQLVMITDLDKPVICNKRSLEAHKEDCFWLGFMKSKNKVRYNTLEKAIKDGYNGCYFCLRKYNTG